MYAIVRIVDCICIKCHARTLRIDKQVMLFAVSERSRWSVCRKCHGGRKEVEEKVVWEEGGSGDAGEGEHWRDDGPLKLEEGQSAMQPNIKTPALKPPGTESRQCDKSDDSHPWNEWLEETNVP